MTEDEALIAEAFQGAWGGESPVQDILYETPVTEDEHANASFLPTTLLKLWFEEQGLTVRVGLFSANGKVYYKAWTDTLSTVMTVIPSLKWLLKKDLRAIAMKDLLWAKSRKP